MTAVHTGVEFLDLPDDVLDHILQCLGPSGSRAFSLLCKRCKGVVETSLMWGTLFRQYASPRELRLYDPRQSAAEHRRLYQQVHVRRTAFQRGICSVRAFPVPADAVPVGLCLERLPDGSTTGRVAFLHHGGVRLYDVRREVGYRSVAAIEDRLQPADITGDTMRRKAVFLRHRLFLASSDNAVNLYNTAAGKRIRSFEAPAGCVRSRAVFVDPAQADLLAVGYVRGGAALFSTATGALLRHVPCDARVYSAEVFLDAHQTPILSLACADGSVRAYDLRTDRILHTLDLSCLVSPAARTSAGRCMQLGRAALNFDSRICAFVSSVLSARLDGGDVRVVELARETEPEVTATDIQPGRMYVGTAAGDLQAWSDPYSAFALPQLRFTVRFWPAPGRLLGIDCSDDVVYAVASSGRCLVLDFGETWRPTARDAQQDEMLLPVSELNSAVRVRGPGFDAV